MRTNDKSKENQDMGKKNGVTNDFVTLQQHLKQLEENVKRLREMIKSNRSSNLY